MKPDDEASIESTPPSPAHAVNHESESTHVVNQESEYSPAHVAKPESELSPAHVVDHESDSSKVCERLDSTPNSTDVFYSTSNSLVEVSEKSENIESIAGSNEILLENIALSQSLHDVTMDEKVSGVPMQSDTAVDDVSVEVMQNDTMDEKVSEVPMQIDTIDDQKVSEVSMQNNTMHENVSEVPIQTDTIVSEEVSGELMQNNAMDEKESVLPIQTDTADEKVSLEPIPNDAPSDEKVSGEPLQNDTADDKKVSSVAMQNDTADDEKVSSLPMQNDSENSSSEPVENKEIIPNSCELNPDTTHSNGLNNGSVPDSECIAIMSEEDKDLNDWFEENSSEVNKKSASSAIAVNEKLADEGKIVTIESDAESIPITPIILPDNSLDNSLSDNLGENVDQELIHSSSSNLTNLKASSEHLNEQSLANINPKSDVDAINELKNEGDGKIPDLSSENCDELSAGSDTDTVCQSNDKNNDSLSSPFDTLDNSFQYSVLVDSGSDDECCDSLDLDSSKPRRKFYPMESVDFLSSEAENKLECCDEWSLGSSSLGAFDTRSDKRRRGSDGDFMSIDSKTVDQFQEDKRDDSDFPHKIFKPNNTDDLDQTLVADDVDGNMNNKYSVVDSENNYGSESKRESSEPESTKSTDVPMKSNENVSSKRTPCTVILPPCIDEEPDIFDDTGVKVLEEGGFFLRNFCCNVANSVPKQEFVQTKHCLSSIFPQVFWLRLASYLCKNTMWKCIHLLE